MKCLKLTLFLTTALLIAGQAAADEQQAIDGCIDRLRETGGPDGAGGQVVSSDFSEAGTLVMLRDAGGTTWRCLAANNGTVEELEISKAADDGSGAMAGSQANKAVVHFPAGASGTTLKGKITGKGYFDYVLGARTGQSLKASLKVVRTNGDGTIYFNVLPPGSSDVAIFNGSMSEDGRAVIRLPSSGDYTIRVYLMGNDEDAGKTVSYNINVSVR